MSTQKEPILQITDIHKGFPGVKALSGVSFELLAGEIHALCGENGAGKSTLIKIITGMYNMDSGEMRMNGQKVDFASPHESIQNGIACIYQELSIVPLLDAAQNLFLGNWPHKNGVLDKKTMYAEAAKVLERVQLDIDPHILAGELSIAQQQMLEIGRALTRDAKIIIMDEPTSSLTEKETVVLLDLVRRLKAEGVAIVYVSHKLDEVLEICDRITVLCDGRNITCVKACDTDRPQLIEYMLGRKLDNMFNKTDTERGEVALKVEGLTREPYFRDVSFEIHKGEVVGFFGLVGAGRSEIMRAVFGVDKPDSGTVTVNGKVARIKSAADAIRCGLGFAPEDRKREGLALGLSIMENMTIAKLPFIKKGLFIDKKARREQTDKYMQEMSVKAPSSAQLVGNLSGGNQQKVVVGKWLMQNPDVLILDEPTRGIDVGSKAEIYGLVNRLAHEGIAVIIVSSEMNEILGVCDRVITVYEGRITNEFDVKSANDKMILSAALGGDAS